jgi:hypothetical protein
MTKETTKETTKEEFMYYANKGAREIVEEIGNLYTKEKDELFIDAFTAGAEYAYTVLTTKNKAHKG